ncbi:aromatic amino acid transporter [Vibrio sp. SS-MA-C1-2]|uniref:aromatic amino acid transporter n=1 Tax=Vibrio sp. SS-MA-C1-2 TaxID=2908646 RepID=UPI001F1AD28D|nr:aromatic amino acid transporter [Vibrio sp. SS-MA-C1-2]UJF19133.1 aromatic amino acid transporter [Vibrio sp. SS-MA-C1-2]
MEKELSPSIFGGACIIASVCVGAGMLGLPSAGAGAWALWSFFAITLTMIIMTFSGWMLLEVFQHYNLRASFDTVTQDLLGKPINLINNIAVYFVGAILLYAYITSSGLILAELLGVDRRLASILFVALFSLFVWHSTRAVDRIAVLLIIFMVLSFIFGISGLMLEVNLTTLFDSAGVEQSYAPYVIAMLPVALTSFGYHHSVSSMRAYYQDEHKASLAILWGTVIALSHYSLWLFSIFGNLPRVDFIPVIAEGGNVDALLKALSEVIDSKSVEAAIDAFSMAAILSSFIGVGLGLFDFLADYFKFDNNKQGRGKSWGVTFIPPLVMSLLFPFGFVVAIGYAGAVATIWTCIIPALLLIKSRQQQFPNKGFKVWGGNGLIYLVLSFGVVTAVIHILTILNVTPSYG